MFQLIYTSVPTDDLTRVRRREIATQSSEINKAANVTGALLISNSTVLQILEGQEDAVRSIYKRIVQNVLHTKCDVLLTRATQTRSFSSWSMGYCSVEDLHAYEVKLAIATLKARRTERQRTEKIAC